MILIGGTSINIETLPFSEVMDYIVESNQDKLLIKLKSVAKQSQCFKIYLQESLQGVELYPDVAEKTTYFRDDMNLINILEALSNSTEEEEIAQEESPQEEVKVFTEEGVQELDETETFNAFEEPTITPKTRGNFIVADTSELEEVDITLPDSFLQIPGIDDDTDSLKLQLDNKQKIIEQKDSVIAEIMSSRDDIFKLQEIQLLEMRDSYEKRVTEANDTIASLKVKLGEMSIDPESAQFLKFAPYSKNYRAALRDGFSENELKTMGKLSSPVYIFASGAGDSLYSMMKNIHMLIDKNPNMVIADFSNDTFLNSKYKLKAKDSSMMLEDDGVSVATLLKELDRVKIIPTLPYNDIALLGLDWGKIMKKLSTFASGKPILLIFNNINSFSVRYTISKLATIGSLFVFVKCNPVILSSLFSDIRFIPEGRVKLVALAYIDVVKQMLEEVAKRYQVMAFNNDVDWKKLGLKI